jgi:RNA polymerase sigma-70 factor (ECF subfamily)
MQARVIKVTRLRGFGRDHETPPGVTAGCGNGEGTCHPTEPEARITYGHVGEDPLADLMKHKALVRSYVDKRVANSGAVDDIVSETYLVAWRRLADVPDDDERAAAWLCGVARNLARNHVRGELRRRRLVERMKGLGETRLEGIASVEPALSAQRLVAADAWRELAPGDRQLLAWAAAGWSNDDIAAELGIRPGTVAMRLMRARNRLAVNAAV